MGLSCSNFCDEKLIQLTKGHSHRQHDMSEYFGRIPFLKKTTQCNGCLQLVHVYVKKYISYTYSLQVLKKNLHL